MSFTKRGQQGQGKNPSDFHFYSSVMARTSNVYKSALSDFYRAAGSYVKITRGVATLFTKVPENPSIWCLPYQYVHPIHKDLNVDIGTMNNKFVGDV